MIAWIDNWYFEPQVACGGRSQHQWANRDWALLNTQEGFLGTGWKVWERKRSHICNWTLRKLAISMLEDNKINGLGEWLLEDLDVILNHDWKVQCGSSDLLGLCGDRYRILKHCWHLQNKYLVLEPHKLWWLNFSACPESPYSSQWEVSSCCKGQQLNRASQNRALLVVSCCHGYDQNFKA